MDDKNDPPIQEHEYLSGVRVVDIGDYRVARGMSRRATSACPHHRMVYDQNERRIWCKDCETDVEGFDAFRIIVEHFSRQTKHLEARERKIKEAEAHTLISRAAKVIDQAWRAKKTVPACPHCKGALFPDDFKDGIGKMPKSYALELQKRSLKWRGN